MSTKFRYFISPFQNIFENLALENFFLRQIKEEVILFYCNEPCVVLGNFQNPWLETNPENLIKASILLARRQSGGGTVYHDLGNLNFCIFRKKSILTQEDKSMHLDMFRDFLMNKRIKTEKLNKSGMVFISSIDQSALKFSGEAFKQTKEMSFHHGTLLINSDLKSLASSLGPSVEGLRTKAVNSNPFKVGNLNQEYSELTPTRFIKEFTDFHSLGIFELELEARKLESEIAQDRKTYSSDEYVYEKTPRFEVQSNGCLLTVEKGKIIETNGKRTTPKKFALSRLSD